LASVIYEHSSEAIRAAVTVTANERPHTLAPTSSAATGAGADVVPTQASDAAHLVGNLTSDLYSHATASAVDNAIAGSSDDDAIKAFCKRFDIEFESLSELNNTSSAICGLFWDPKSNWIVVCCKGTGFIEFGEWLSDFNAAMADCEYSM
jgi:hypothetical protein